MKIVAFNKEWAVLEHNELLEQAKKDFAIFVKEYDEPRINIFRFQDVLNAILVEQLESLADRDSSFIGEYVKMYLKWYDEALEPYN